MAGKCQSRLCSEAGDNGAGSQSSPGSNKVLPRVMAVPGTAGFPLLSHLFYRQGKCIVMLANIGCEAAIPFPTLGKEEAIYSKNQLQLVSRLLPYME